MHDAAVAARRAATPGRCTCARDDRGCAVDDLDRAIGDPIAKSLRPRPTKWSRGIAAEGGGWLTRVPGLRRSPADRSHHPGGGRIARFLAEVHDRRLVRGV